MIGAIARRLFGSANDRYIKVSAPLVDKINALEPALTTLSDEELAARRDIQGSGSRTAKPSTTSCPKPSPRCARPRSARSASAISTCS